MWIGLLRILLPFAIKQGAKAINVRMESRDMELLRTELRYLRWTIIGVAVAGAALAIGLKFW